MHVMVGEFVWLVSWCVVGGKCTTSKSVCCWWGVYSWWISVLLVRRCTAGESVCYWWEGVQLVNQCVVGVLRGHTQSRQHLECVFILILKWLTASLFKWRKRVRPRSRYNHGCGSWVIWLASNNYTNYNLSCWDRGWGIKTPSLLYHLGVRSPSVFL